MEEMEKTRTVPGRPPPPRRTADMPCVIETIRNYKDLQKVHDSAHKLVNSGLEADERNDIQEAMRCYSQGLRLINLAMRIDCEQWTNAISSDQVDDGKQMQQKMTKTKQQITFRIQSIEIEQRNANDSLARTELDNPPSYEDAMSDRAGSCTGAMDAEMMSLGDSIMNDEVDTQDLTDASHLFSIEDGVQIFYISPDGLVSAPSYPSSLHIVKLRHGNQQLGESNPPAFIHVNDWVCPLVPGSSPVLETAYGAYVFPDLMSQQAGAAVGLMLPDSIPPETRQKFEQIIRSFTIYQTETVPVEDLHQNVTGLADEDIISKEPQSTSREGSQTMDTSTKISKGIIIAADWISWGLSKGAEKAGKLIRTGSEKIRQKTKPAMEEHRMDPRIKKGLVYARKATHVSVQVTGYLVSKLGEATSALAKEIAPHLRETGEKVLPKSVKKTDENGKSKLDGVVEVAASGLQGFGTIYVSLEAAAKTLGKSLATETVSIVHHRYGAEAGEVTEHSMYTVGNAAMTAFNANNFGIKAVAKRTAKDTGQALINDINKNKTGSRGYVPCEESDDSEAGAKPCQK